MGTPAVRLCGCATSNGRLDCAVTLLVAFPAIKPSAVYRLADGTIPNGSALQTKECNFQERYPVCTVQALLARAGNRNSVNTMHGIYSASNV